MALTRDRCVCLRKTEYSETSQIVTLFSREHGIIRAIAKGAHRKTKAGSGKFDGGMDFLELGEAVFTLDPMRELSILTEWTLCDGHLGLRQDLRAICLALSAGEWVDRLLEIHDPHPAMFDRLTATLQGICSPVQEESFLAFQLDLLREVGYLPELTCCVGCLGPAELTGLCHFSSEGGGFVCRQCERSIQDRVPIHGDLLRVIRAILSQPADQERVLPPLTRVESDPINRILDRFVQQMLGRPMAMGRWVWG